MIPYPNLRSLAVGQCIKFADNCLFKKFNINNGAFLKKINKTANWLAQSGIQKGHHVLVHNLISPDMEILNYAIWSLGAILVISSEDDTKKIKNHLTPDFIINELSSKDNLEINNQSEEFYVKNNTLLSDDALLSINDNKAIRLSHYNLLINTYGVLKHLNILHNETLNINLPFNTTAAIVLKTILPLYAGTSVSDNSAKIKFCTNEKSDYQIVFDWKKFEDTKPQSLYVLPEATAILAIGTAPNHLISIDDTENTLIIKGHSVMQGYLNQQQNETVFKSGGLKISK